jgi:putative DNA primase/helicase
VCFFYRNPYRRPYKDKPIIIAGDDDHRLENNPGREKAVEAAAAVKGLAVFPKLSTEQREQGMTDFNDLGRAQPEGVSRQLAATVSDTREGRTLRLEHAPSMELAR